MRIISSILLLSVLYSCADHIGGRYDLEEVKVNESYVPQYFHMQAIDPIRKEWIVFYYDGYNQQTLSFIDDRTAVGEFDIYEAVHEFSGRKMTVTHTQFAHTDTAEIKMQAIYNQR